MPRSKWSQSTRICRTISGCPSSTARTAAAKCPILVRLLKPKAKWRAALSLDSTRNKGRQAGRVEEREGSCCLAKWRMDWRRVGGCGWQTCGNRLTVTY
jgi:hypothetical protein